ncbi:hypothetical protein AXG93_606s1340 [Marchantia polymorpha subsp. ruderalis]|uniref:Uncharacterized protein n=1 Tax=Marchantia polymorpha subsp. ruderalis TaxID=1480154 RepID=A0A176VJB5_MARPO|nr:hypothetical protein AXG93_606s1340 [Marchantia polymorpha subsp. ruderalis]
MDGRRRLEGSEEKGDRVGIMHIIRPARTTYVTAWQEQPERGVAKKRKVVNDDEEELAHTKHEDELKDWAKKLAEYESAKSSEVECRLKVESDCRRLREQLGKSEMRSEESQRRMQKAEDAYRQLREDSTDVLRLRLCLEKFQVVSTVLHYLLSLRLKLSSVFWE